MSSIINDVNHLSTEIGARPAGTEEERLAAMYIGEKIQKRSGLSFDIEDFDGAKGKYRITNFLSIASALVLFISILLKILTIPALIITLAIAIILVLEYIGKPIISKFFKVGISQNVVVKYSPSYSVQNKNAARKRKIVLISHYDTGRTYNGNYVSLLALDAYTRLAAIICSCFIPIYLIVKMLAFEEAAGSFLLLNVILCVVLLIICSLPCLVSLYKNKLLYNEGGNCNAAGNAALIEIAKQIGTGSYGNIENDDIVVHGKDEAESAGVVPEGANLNYSVPANTEAQNQDGDVLVDKEQNLANAKAAIAAFTAPRKARAQYDNEGNKIDDNQGDKVIDKASDDNQAQPNVSQNNNDTSVINPVTIDDASAKRANTSDSVSAFPEFTSKKTPGEVPAWFTAAKSKAKKTDEEPNNDNENIHRSRFAHTMDAMEQKRQEAEAAKKAAEEEKRAKLRQQIEAAKKAAEEERQKKMGQEKPFFRNEQDADSTTAINIPAENETSSAAQTNPVSPVKEQMPNINKADSPVAASVSQGDNAKPVEPAANAVNTQETSAANAQEATAANTAEIATGEVKTDEPVAVDAKPQEPVSSIPPVEPKQEEAKNDQAFTEESLSLDERFKLHQKEIKSKSINKPPVENQDKPQDLKTEESQKNSNDVQKTEQIDLSDTKQYAPLDDESFISGNNTLDNSSIADLPEVYDELENPEVKTDNDIPAVTNDATSNVASEEADSIERGKFGTGSFAAVSANDGVAGASGAFSPVTEEIIADAEKSGEIAKKDDLVINDADDSDYTAGNFTESGAFAGDGYLDMPDEKKKGIFGVFGKKKKESKPGKHASNGDSPISMNTGDKIGDDSWEGGAFAGIANKFNRKAQQPADDNPIEDVQAEQDFVENENAAPAIENEKFSDAPITSEKSRISSMVDAVPEFEEQIKDFHGASINMDVWMVALGSEVDENAGINSFLIEHAEELRGAIIIDIEGLGKGELSLVNSEGLIFKSKTNSRLKRYVRQAANKLGVAVPAINSPYTSSSAYFANRKGFASLRFVGADANNQIAGYMSADDTAEFVDENIIKKNINYLLELIQCI